MNVRPSTPSEQQIRETAADPQADAPPYTIAWRYTAVVVTYHVLALLAFVPWFFSWAGVWTAAAGVMFFNVLGINIGYHRLLAHRGFACSRWFEYTLAMIGLLCMQDSPTRWVAVHRRHHQHADEDDDPHSPRRGFFWAHMGWLLVDHRDLTRYGIYNRYARDLQRDAYYRFLERNIYWILLASWIAFFLAGYGASRLAGGSNADAIQFGASILVWGIFVRTVIGWHATWSVNSATHLWGYRNYETDEDSRNNAWVAYMTAGEGWHNNHHADPRAASHGHKPWEFDLSFVIIRFFEKLGLVWKVALPRVAHYGDAPLATRHGEDFPASP